MENKPEVVKKLQLKKEEREKLADLGAKASEVSSVIFKMLKDDKKLYRGSLNTALDEFVKSFIDYEGGVDEETWGVDNVIDLFELLHGGTS